MTEYAVYMCSRMLGMITNHVILSRRDVVSSLLWRWAIVIYKWDGTEAG